MTHPQNPMDIAARRAANELQSHKRQQAFATGLQTTAVWWKAQYGKAGHKRLGQLIVRVALKGAEQGLQPNGTPGDNKLDQAAEAARCELCDQLQADPQISQGLKAFAKWYCGQYGKAGHKRLGRLIIAQA